MTEKELRFPTLTLVYRFVAGFETRRGLRGARRAGFLPGGRQREAFEMANAGPAHAAGR